MQGWSDAPRQEHGGPRWHGYWNCAGICQLLDAATGEVLFSELVYQPRVAMPLLEVFRVVYFQSSALVQIINANIKSRTMQIVLQAKARYLRWANCVADASILCLKVQSS